MKVKFLFLSLIGMYDALSLSDELKALVNFDEWAQTSIENHNSISGKLPAGTARAAQRLRAIRADLLTLLANAPINDRQNDAEKSENSVNHDEMVLSAQFDEAEGSTSGDWDVDVNQLISDNSNSRDIAIMVRHGLLDDMLQNTNVDLKSSNSLSATIIEPANDKRFPSRTLNKTEILEEDTPVASMEDVPTFDKLIMSHRNPRKPKLVTGENSNGTSSKSQWLTLSVVGSLAAIVLTVTLTVFARRIKSGKNNNSGTPVQKLRRFNLKNSPQSQQTVRRPQFTGYNAAYRPQSMDSGIDYSTNSSQISTSSGSSGPRRQHRPNNGHVVNFAHQPNGGHSQTTYPNRNRALPPPPYSRIQY